MNLSGTGYTTGTCAAAAAKAAVSLLCGLRVAQQIDVVLPNGERVCLPVAFARMTERGAEAGVLKDAGDDPDVSHGATIIASAEWNDGRRIVLSEKSGLEKH